MSLSQDDEKSVVDTFLTAVSPNVSRSSFREPGRYQQIVDSFKVAFQKPDKEAASFTKAQFQQIREALGEKLASVVAKRTLAKAGQSSQHPW